jgi:hypothetical protein
MNLSFIGRLLRNRRADGGLSVWFHPGLDAPESVIIASPDFGADGPLPRSSAGKGVGDNLSPALSWHGVPPEANHLVFVLEDVDVPFARPLIHTLSILAPATTSLAAGGLAAGAPGIEAVRGLGRSGYQGPRPIPGHGAHHYGFMLFAVDADVDTSSQKAAIESIAGHVLARGRIVGTYEQA